MQKKIIKLPIETTKDGKEKHPKCSLLSTVLSQQHEQY